MYTNGYRTLLQALIKLTQYKRCLCLSFPCKSLAVPKNLGLGLNFRPCSEGYFLSGRPQSVPTVVCAELQTRPGNLSLCAYCYGQQYRSEGSTITYHGAFGNKNNSWVLNNHFYPTKSYSKWNMAGKTNLSASRSMQFLTGKSHLARRIFFSK